MSFMVLILPFEGNKREKAILSLLFFMYILFIRKRPQYTHERKGIEMIIIQNLIRTIGFSNSMVPILLTWTPSGLSIVEGGPLAMSKGREYIVMNPPDIQGDEGTLYHTQYNGYTEVKNLEQLDSDLRGSTYIRISIGHSGYIYLKPDQCINAIINEERTPVPANKIKEGDVIPLIYIHECGKHIYFKSSNGDIWQFIHSSPIPKKIISYFGKWIANRRIKKDLQNSGYLTGDKYYITDNHVTSVAVVNGVLPQKHLPIRLIDSKPFDKELLPPDGGFIGMRAPILVKLSNYTNACVTLDVLSIQEEDN